MASRSFSLTLTVASLGALALGVVLSSQTPTTGRVKSPSERAAARIRALEREADALAAQESRLLVELRKLEVERQLKAEELASIEQQQIDTAWQLAEATRKAEELKRRAETDRPDVETRLVQLYKLGRAGYWRLLLDVDDLRSLGRAYRTAAALTRLDRDRIQGYQRTLEALAKERATLQARSTQLATLEEQATRARAALDRAVGARAALVTSIDARRDLNAQLTSELEAAQQKLQTSVNQLDANGERNAALPFRPFQGALPWPARGRLVAPFGRQPTSRFGTAIVKDGIEIGVTEGQPVRSVHEGAVGFAGQFTGYGNLVIVDHGDRAFSLYGHLGSVQVAQGERIEAQTAVGASGRNPAGIPAVYFGLRVDGKPVDPLQWLEKGPQ